MAPARLVRGGRLPHQAPGEDAPAGAWRGYADHQSPGSITYSFIDEPVALYGIHRPAWQLRLFARTFRPGSSTAPCLRTAFTPQQRLTPERPPPVKTTTARNTVTVVSLAGPEMVAITVNAVARSLTSRCKPNYYGKNQRNVNGHHQTVRATCLAEMTAEPKRVARKYARRCARNCVSRRPAGPEERPGAYLVKFGTLPTVTFLNQVGQGCADPHLYA